MDESIQYNESLIDRLTSVEQLLAEYEEKIYINKISIIEPNLSIGREMMIAMYPEDLYALAWEYAEYTLALQKEINRHQSRYNWAETNLKRLLEKESPEYPGWKWEERMANCLSDNTYAQKLFSLKTKSKMVIDRLAFLPAKVNFLAELAKDIAYTKRRYSNVEQSSS